VSSISHKIKNQPERVSIYEGDTVDVSVEITNFGGGSSTSSGVLYYEIQDTEILGSVTIPAIPGRGTINLTIIKDWNTTSYKGLWNIVLRIEYKDEELLKANNLLIYDKFYIQDKLPPDIQDLYISNEYFSPNNDTVRDDTEIFFNLNEESYVEVKIYDEFGYLRRELFSGTLTPGLHRVLWDGYTDLGYVADDLRYQIQIIAIDMSNNKTIKTISCEIDKETRYYPG
jgi:hypothetical protein